MENFTPIIPNRRKQGDRIRQACLGINGYKNKGQTKVNELYAWCKQGIQGTLGFKAGSILLNDLTHNVFKFEEPWYHLRKEQQQKVLKYIIDNLEKQEFQNWCTNYLGIDINLLNVLSKKLENLKIQLEHDFAYQKADKNTNRKYDTDIGPAGMSINENFIEKGGLRLFNIFSQIYSAGLPEIKSKEIWTTSFQNKLQDLINTQGDLRKIDPALWKDYKFKRKVFYGPKETELKRKLHDQYLEVVKKGLNENNSVTIYKRQETASSEDFLLSNTVFYLIQDYVFKTGKGFPCTLFYFSKSKNSLEKKQIEFFGLKRGQNHSSVVFLSDMPNIVSTEIKLWQIIGITIQPNFLPNLTAHQINNNAEEPVDLPPPPPVLPPPVVVEQNEIVPVIEEEEQPLINWKETLKYKLKQEKIRALIGVSEIKFVKDKMGKTLEELTSKEAENLVEYLNKLETEGQPSKRIRAPPKRLINGE